MDRIRSRRSSRSACCDPCGQPADDCCGGTQFAPADGYGVPGGEPTLAPQNGGDMAPAQIVPDQGVNRNPIVDPSAFILNSNGYSTTN